MKVLVSIVLNIFNIIILARSVQGGASLAHHQLLVRLATRFHSKTSELFEEQLIEYILADQKNHADLALLWLNELYAQYQVTF
jgi:hypothetical protein